MSRLSYGMGSQGFGVLFWAGARDFSLLNIVATGSDLHFLLSLPHILKYLKLNELHKFLSVLIVLYTHFKEQ
jgi:hypothetical protein